LLPAANCALHHHCLSCLFPSSPIIIIIVLFLHSTIPMFIFSPITTAIIVIIVVIIVTIGVIIVIVIMLTLSIPLLNLLQRCFPEPSKSQAKCHL
jgi:hypothetical protein